MAWIIEKKTLRENQEVEIDPEQILETRLKDNEIEIWYFERKYV